VPIFSSFIEEKMKSEPIIRVLVACHDGEGVVLDYSTPDFDWWLDGAGSRRLSDLDLDDAPDGLSVWEGVLKSTHYHTPDANEWDTTPVGKGKHAHQRMRLHSLGISGGMAVPACTWIARNLPAGTDYTTDSSSWLVGCNFGAYYVFNDKSAIHQWLMWEAKKSLKSRPYLPGMTLPCSCEVCAAVRWVDVMRHPSYATGLAMSYHNLFVLKSYEAVWCAHAQNSETLGDYLEFVRAMEGVKARTILGTVKYIDYAFKHGLDEAESRYSSMLSSGAREEMEELFKEDDDELQAVTNQPSRVASDTKKISELSQLGSVAGNLEFFRQAGIEEYLAGKAEAPSQHALYTGFLMTAKLADKARTAARKQSAKEAESATE
jgi:hypothetical protein